MTRDDLLARLDALGIMHETHDHAPAMTVEDGRALHGHMPGVHTKNLFLKDEKGALFLVTAPWERAINLKRLHPLIGCRRLSFGSAVLLEECLGVKPGAVTALAIINDTAGRVTPVLDHWMTTQNMVNCHPLVNTATTLLKVADLLRFIEATGHQAKIIDLDLTNLA